jgi:hypothetical protein
MITPVNVVLDVYRVTADRVSIMTHFEIGVEYPVEKSTFPLYNTAYFERKYGKTFVAYPEVVLVEREMIILCSLADQWKGRVAFVDSHKLDFEVIVTRVEDIMQSVMLIEKALFPCRFSLP